MKKSARFFSILLLVAHQALAADESIYIVKNGDTLSTIAQSKIGSPVYPKITGSLTNLKSLNPSLNQRELIFPGQVLLISSADQADKLANIKSLKSKAEALKVTHDDAPSAALDSSFTETRVSKSLPKAAAQAPTDVQVQIQSQSVPKSLPSGETRSADHAPAEIQPPNGAQAFAPNIHSSKATPELPENQVTAPRVLKTDRVPASEPIALPVEDEEIAHRLGLSAGFGMTSLQGTDPSNNRSATFQSKYDANISATWAQEWTESFSSALKGSVRAVEFAQPTSSLKSLSRPSQALSGLELSFSERLGQRLHLIFGGGMSQELSIQGVSSNVVSVEAINIPRAFIAAEGTLLRRGKTSVGLNGRVDYLFSQSADGYTVNSGVQYGAGIFLKRVTRAERFYVLNLDFKDRRQNMSVTNFEETSLAADLIMSLPLFEENSK